MPRLTRRELLEISASIYGETVAGSSDAEIMDLFGLDAETFNEARRFMLEMKADEVRGKPREHTYIEYCQQQERNIRDLTKLVNELEALEKKQSTANAIVGAIRLRSDILDKIIEKGQEFGLIKKEPERKEIFAGVLVGDMTTKELRKAIMEHASKTNDMVKRFGDKDIMELPEAPLHYGPAAITTTAEPVTVDPEKKTRRPKAKTSRRSAGRKRLPK